MLSGGLSSQEPGAIRGVSGTWSTGVTAISGKAFLLSRRSLAVPLSAFFKTFPWVEMRLRAFRFYLCRLMNGWDDASERAWVSDAPGLLKRMVYIKV